MRAARDRRSSLKGASLLKSAETSSFRLAGMFSGWEKPHFPFCSVVFRVTRNQREGKGRGTLQNRKKSSVHTNKNSVDIIVSVRLSVCLSACRSACLFVCLFVCHCLSVCLCLCLSLPLSPSLLVCLSVCLSASPSASVCLSGV